MNLIRDESGVTAIDYAFTAALIAVAAVVLMGLAQDALADDWYRHNGL